MGNDEMQNEIRRQGKEIEDLKSSVNVMVMSVNALTEAIAEQNTQMAVYIAKHEHVDGDLKVVRAEVKAHGLHIAEMKPTVDSMRTLAWKVLGSSLLSGGVVAAVIAVLNK